MDGAKYDIEHGKGLTAMEAAEKHGITNSTDLYILQALETRVTNTGGPRARNGPMSSATDLISYEGFTAKQAADAVGITHREDLEDLQATATRIANSGGPRARGGAIANAQTGIKNRQLSVEQAAAEFGIRHPRDLEILQRFKDDLTR